MLESFCTDTDIAAASAGEVWWEGGEVWRSEKGSEGGEWRGKT